MVSGRWSDISIDGKQGILWDLDNTLYLYEPTHKTAYAACRSLAEQKFGISHADFDTYWKQARNKVHHTLHGLGASHSRLLYLQNLHELWKGHTNAEFAMVLEEHYWSVFLDNMQWRQGAFELMEKAHGSGVQMAIVTDLTAHIQLRKFEKLGLDRYVKYLISSEEAGVEKPEPYIFLLALEKLNLKPEQVIMIGDSFEKDIQGAQKLNISAYQIDDNTL